MTDQIDNSLKKFIIYLSDQTRLLQFSRTYSYWLSRLRCSKVTCIDNPYMETESYTSHSDGFRFRCPKCRSTKSIRTDSLMSGFNMPALEFFIGIYLFFNFESKISRYMKECGFKSKKTARKFVKVLRNVCLEHYILNVERIGGNGQIVQIDETLLFKRKGNVGRVLRQIWIIGGIDETGELFLRKVENRTSETMIEVFHETCNPSTQFWTDGWSAYPRAVSSMDDSTHEVVNHSENFVSPSGVHTQNIENAWKCLKVWMRKNNYNHESERNIPEYLGEYLFKRKYVDIGVSGFGEIIRAFLNN